MTSADEVDGPWKPECKRVKIRGWRADQPYFLGVAVDPDVITFGLWLASADESVNNDASGGKGKVEEDVAWQQYVSQLQNTIEVRFFLHEFLPVLASALGSKGLALLHEYATSDESASKPAFSFPSLSYHRRGLKPAYLNSLYTPERLEIHPPYFEYVYSVVLSEGKRTESACFYLVEFVELWNKVLTLNQIRWMSQYLADHPQGWDVGI